MVYCHGLKKEWKRIERVSHPIFAPLLCNRHLIVGKSLHVKEISTPQNLEKQKYGYLKQCPLIAFMFTRKVMKVLKRYILLFFFFSPKKKNVLYFYTLFQLLYLIHMGKH
jgi:hypothetical protein